MWRQTDVLQGASALYMEKFRGCSDSLVFLLLRSFSTKAEPAWDR